MTAATAVPAATIILVDRAATRLRVLMLHRSASLAAFPDVWAFPGGQVDVADRDPAWLDRLNPSSIELGRRMRTRDASSAGFTTRDYLQRMHIQAPDPDRWIPAVTQEDELWSYWIAAVRECFEETGIRLAGWSSGGMLNFSQVHYVGRLVPPPRVPRRFDTRFFAATANVGAVRPAVGEVQDYQWIEVEEALDSLPLANPTRYVLVRLREWQTPRGMLNMLQQRW